MAPAVPHITIARERPPFPPEELERYLIVVLEGEDQHDGYSEEQQDDSPGDARGRRHIFSPVRGGVVRPKLIWLVRHGEDLKARRNPNASENPWLSRHLLGTGVLAR